jgi:hypothetical protein
MLLNNILLTFKKATMKNLCTLSLCLCITLSSFIASAQESNSLAKQPDYSRPKLFTNLPEKIKVDLNQVNSLFDKQAGQEARLSATENQSVQFEGNVVFSVTNNDSKLKSVMLSLPSFPGARLSITRLTNEDGTTIYAGRILSFQHGDAYLLQKEDDGYVFVKKNFYNLVNE